VRRRLFVIAVAVLSAVILALPAPPAAPPREDFNFTDTAVLDVCSFPVMVELTPLTGTAINLFDRTAI
jgi:hypothetical protein